ncbi:MAG: M56 family metallopeptidase, partial [Bacteroidota bacterium]
MTDPQWLTIATALGWTLVHSLWQIALIALLLKALLSISSNQSAHLRYGWSLVAMFAVLIGAGVTFGYYYEPIVPVIIENLPDLENNTWTDKMMPLESAEGTASWETWMIAVEQYLPYLVMAWLFGICCYTILMVQGFFQLKNLQRLHSNPVPKQWEHRLSELQAQLGIQRNVQFLTCKSLDEPITFGHFKPIILVPVGLLTGLSTAQVEVLLLHELAHIRRYDYLVNWLQSSLETLFFYHPAFWWISRQVRAEREHCCDDLVLGLHPAPMLYAQTLTQLQINHYSIKTNLAMAATKNQGAFTTRIHRLFGQYNSPNRQKKGGILMILLAIAMVTVAFYEPISLEERQDLTPANTVVVDTFPPNIQISPIIPESGNLDLFYRSEEAPMIYIDGKLASLEELRQIDVKAYDYCAFTEQEVAFYTKGSLASKQGRLFNDEQGVPSLTSDQLSPVELEKRIQAGEYAIIIGELAGNLSDDERTELKQIFETAFSDDTEDDFEYHVNAVLNENGDWEYDTTYSIQVEEDASGLDLSIKRANASPKGENMEQMIERLEKLNNEEQGLYIDRIRLSKNETGTVDTFINVRTRTAKLADKTKSRKILSLEDDEKRVDIKVKSDKKEQPLIVIDGRVVGKKPKAHLKTIDPDDISEINVLKGEAALEKYGEKGSDGVIEITTKASNKRKVHLEVIVFPEQEKIRFELGMNFNSSGNWAVYDPNGKKMEIKFEDTKGVENDRDLTIIDWLVKDLQAGTYTTTLEANGKKLKRK